MAKNFDDELKEEDGFDAEDLEDKEEQDFKDEYSDDDGESTSPTTGARKKSGLEFICLSCGKRKKSKKAGSPPECCGAPTTPVDFIAKSV